MALFVAFLNKHRLYRQLTPLKKTPARWGKSGTTKDRPYTH